jgi:hypothetical protein
MIAIRTTYLEDIPDMRLIIWLAAPVAVLAAAATVTIIEAWGSGTGSCGTWLSVILPVCR